MIVNNLSSIELYTKTYVRRQYFCTIETLNGLFFLILLFPLLLYDMLWSDMTKYIMYVGPSEGEDPWGDEDDYYCIWEDED